MRQNMPVPRFKLSSFRHFVTTASSYPKWESAKKGLGVGVPGKQHENTYICTGRDSKANSGFNN